jgi:RNA polymerase sigma factor (sigma-70 family)
MERQSTRRYRRGNHATSLAFASARSSPGCRPRLRPGSLRKQFRPRSRAERWQALTRDAESSTTVGDTIVDAAEQAYQQVLDELEMGYVRDLTAELGERERAMIRAHYGLGEHAQTLSEIGACLGLTVERARRIEAGALSKLRAALAQRAAVAGRCDLKTRVQRLTTCTR